MSTGGGASLELLELGDLPGLAALREAPNAHALTRRTRPLISGNWKMHLNHFEAIQTVQKLAYLLDRKDDPSASTSACTRRSPTCASVQTADRRRRASRSPLGAQHCHWEDKGAFTGEIVAGVPRQAQRAAT